MKKLICLLLCVFILMFAFSTCVFAAGVTVSPVSDLVQKGETLQVKVTFDAGKPVYAFEYVLTYDTERLELIGVTDGQYNESEKGRVYVVNFASSSKNTVYFNFKTKKAGATTLNITDALAASATEEIKFQNVSRTVTVDSPTRGDANGDGTVDTTDLALLKLYLAGEAEEIDDLSDYNRDSVIDTTDLALLKNYLSEG